jgi:SAM-dependent methyltransferase
LRRIASRLYAIAFRKQNPVVWPSILEELGPYRQYFKGKVLNAGAGDRDLTPLVDGELVNQDLPHGLHNARIDILSPLHAIPVAAEHFDCIICNAVLEHVENPELVLVEFYRVLKSGGYLYLSVPFLQPEHLDPTDFQRYTKDGLRSLVERHGFDVLKVEGLHSVYHTLAWILDEWLNSRRSLRYWMMRQALYPILRYKMRHSKLRVDSIASGYRVLASKRGEGPPTVILGISNAEF